MRASQNFLRKERSLMLGTSQNPAQAKKEIMSKISKDEFDFDKYYLTQTTDVVKALQTCANQIYRLIINKIAGAGYHSLVSQPTRNANDQFIAKHVPSIAKLDTKYRAWYSQTLPEQIKQYSYLFIADDISRTILPDLYAGSQLITQAPESGFALFSNHFMHLGNNSYSSLTTALIGSAMEASGNANMYQEVLSVMGGDRSTENIPVNFNLRTSEYSSGTVRGPFKLLVQDDQQQLIFITGTYAMHAGGQGSITNLSAKAVASLNQFELTVANYEPQIKHVQRAIAIPQSILDEYNVRNAPTKVIVDAFEFNMLTDTANQVNGGRARVYAIIP